MRHIRNILHIATLMSALLLSIGVQGADKDTVSVSSNINVERLPAQPDLKISNTLQGRAAGLITIANTGDFGEASSSFYIRGQHRGTSNNTALVIIDGTPRSIDELIVEEIESIQILKDATAKILYGSLAANGVILVTTKRGTVKDKSVKVGVEFGIQQVTKTPSFLGAYDYAKLYNEACANDGLSAYYSDTELKGFQNSEGVNDQLYPNADYYDYFLKKNASFRKAVVQMDGGTNRVKYALTLGYTGGNGIEKVGSTTNQNNLNLRANLDVKVTDFLTIQGDIAAKIAQRNWGIVSGSSLFEDLSTLRPNEYTFQYTPEFLTKQGVVVGDETMLYGASNRKSNNLYMQMAEGGSSAQRASSSEASIKFIFDFDKYVKGLSARANVTFDDYTTLTQAMTNKYQTYYPERYYNEAGDLVRRYTLKQKTDLPKNQSITSSSTYRYLMVNADVAYRHAFENSVLDLDALYKYTMEEKTGSNQDVKNDNIAFRANYNFGGRYILQGTIAAMGSNKFEKPNKYFLAYAVGASWVISNEGFLKDSNAVNHLELKASYGHLGYDGAVSHFLYRTNWYTSGSVAWRPSLSQSKAYLSRLGNPNLKWEYTNDLNVGIVGKFFSDRLSAEFNWFREDRKNIIGINSAKYSSVGGEFIPYENVGEVLNSGFDGALSWSGGNADGFNYTIGANFTYSKNSVISTTSVLPNEDYLNPIGKPTSTIFGLQSQGLFGKDVNLENHAKQVYGDYQKGDIAYADLNNDGVVDDKDKTSLGQSFPTAVFGIDVNLNYKGFGLYILGTAQTGLTKMLTNAYYWNNGLNSYSTLAKDSYHPTRNPNGTQPRLTTATGGNNFLDSSFWAADGSFFRLKNVELSYTLNTSTVIKQYKFFVRGTNLFSLSKIKDLDPELPDAGVSNYPVFRTFTGGLSINF